CESRHTCNSHRSARLANCIACLMTSNGLEEPAMSTVIAKSSHRPAAQPIVTHDQWLVARKALLEREKELTRLGDQVARERRALPWVRMDKDYLFDTVDGRRPLADLFDGRHQLLMQHFMLAPGWEQGCKSCSYMADHTDATLPHLAARDTAFVAVSR